MTLTGAARLSFERQRHDVPDLFERVAALLEFAPTMRQAPGAVSDRSNGSGARGLASACELGMIDARPKVRLWSVAAAALVAVFAYWWLAAIAAPLRAAVLRHPRCAIRSHGRRTATDWLDRSEGALGRVILSRRDVVHVNHLESASLSVDAARR